MSLNNIAERTVQKALKMGASQAEISVFTADSALTRYTKNIIHQNVTAEIYYTNVEVAVGKNKRGSSAVNSIEEKEIEKAVQRAIGIAKVSTPDTDFKSFVEPKTIQPLDKIYRKSTAEFTPEQRVEGVKTIIDAAMDYSRFIQWSAGSFTTEQVGFALANSLGVDAETKYTHATVEVTTLADRDGEGTGFAVLNSHDVKGFNLEEMARSAAKDAADSVNPKTLPIGDYEAVFPPEAVTTFTGFIGMLGFSAKSYQEGYSFILDKIGSQVFDEKLTIVDDGRSLNTYNALPFDGEGTPKKKLSLLNKGVPENLCYDNYTAKKDGAESTGHALPKFVRGFFYRGFPLPVNQVVAPGDASLDEMIEDTKKGVYITRLHYVNPIRRDKAVISGLTRDACWYIENGEIKYPIKVMRFTDAIPRVFGEIDAVGDKTTVSKNTNVTTPAIKVAKFKFTGQSEF